MNLKKTKLAAATMAAVVAAAGVAGCVDEEAVQRAVNRDIQQQANKEALAAVGDEKQQLAEFVARAQQTDPSIQSAYYTTDPATGEKVLNVVRQSDKDTDGDGVMDMVAYGLMGAAMGAILSNSFSSSKDYRSSLSRNASSTNYRSREEERRYHSSATAAYVSTRKASAMTSIRSNPSRLKSIRSGVMSRASSARSASYGKGS